MPSIFPADWMPYFAGAGSILMRISGFMVWMPFFRHPAVPMRIRAVILVHLTGMVFLALGMPTIQSASLATTTLALGTEFILGLALGLIVRAVLEAASGMGFLISYGIGLGFAAYYDPTTESSSSALGSVLTILTVMLVLILDAHLAFLRTIFETFQPIPVGKLAENAEPLSQSGLAIASFGAQYFALCLKLAAPALAVSLMIYTVLAVLAKVAPQMNLFAFGFVLTIPSGLYILATTMPEVMGLMTDHLQRLPDTLRVFVRTGQIAL